MAEHAYVKYINDGGLSQMSSEGAMFKQTITMDGFNITKSVIGPVEESDIEAWRRANSGGGSDPNGEADEKADE